MNLKEELKPLTLFLVRHGNTFGPDDTCVQVGAKTDLSLVKKGEQQAKAVGEWFKENTVTPAAIYSGNLKRQRESAEIASSVLNYERTKIIKSDALTEVDFGKWEGLTVEKIKESWPTEFEAWQTKSIFPENIFEETFSDKQEAISRWLESLISKYQNGETIIAFSSGATIRSFYSLIPAEWRKLQKSNLISELKVSTGHICQLQIERSGIRVMSWNLKP